MRVFSRDIRIMEFCFLHLFIINYAFGILFKCFKLTILS